MRRWSKWESMARDGFFQQLHEEEVLEVLSTTRLGHCMKVVGCTMWSITDQPLYTLLRLMGLV